MSVSIPVPLQSLGLVLPTGEEGEEEEEELPQGIITNLFYNSVVEEIITFDHVTVTCGK